MKKPNKKGMKTAFMLALPVAIFIVAYYLYSYYKRAAPVEDAMLYEDTNLQQVNSVRSSRLKSSIDKEIDSIRHLPTGDLWGLFYDDFISGTQQDTALMTKQNNDFSIQNDNRDIPDNEVLQGPSAVFTHAYSLAIGKPVPVIVSWTSDSVLAPTKFQLVTITLNDIADNKAGFTLMDSSAILLYSGANYAANDKILIEDEKHDLHISVLQVDSDTVKIEFASHLNNEVISRLPELE